MVYQLSKQVAIPFKPGHFICKNINIYAHNCGNMSEIKVGFLGGIFG